MAERVFTPAGLDALPPLEMARKAEQVGVVKAGMSTANTFALSVLAGAFIALGAIFATTVTAGGADVPFGVVRLLGGLAFSLGLILVVVAGAELFTGNNLIVMAWAGRRVRTVQVARNWTIVYLGNLVGRARDRRDPLRRKQYEFGGGAVGVQALSIAAAKTDLGFVQAVALGMLCNGLVCLAVWLCYSARTTTDKILSIIPPIAAFVAAGFEHCVANMFFIPMGLLVKSDDAFVSAQGDAVPDLSTLTWERFVGANLVPVTIGNIVGGAVMVGAIYWFVYLRKQGDVPPLSRFLRTTHLVGQCAPAREAARPRTRYAAGARRGRRGRRVTCAPPLPLRGRGDCGGHGRSDVAVEDARDDVVGRELLGLHDRRERLCGGELHLGRDLTRPPSSAPRNTPGTRGRC